MATPVLPARLAPIDDLRRDRSGRVGRRMALDRIASWTLPLLFLVAIVPILDLVYWVVKRALPGFGLSVLLTDPNGNAGGLYAPLVGSLAILLIATAVAILFGLFGGIATAEFIPENWAGIVRITANVMVGTPAIIVGLFGYFVFVQYFGWHFTLAAASVTLGIFMTPYVFRAADLAYTSVPPHIREAAFGSGANPMQYLVRVATPIAFPQVLTGVFLAMAIGVGETAPLVLTTAQTELPPTGLFAPSNALPFYIWNGFSSVFPSQIRLAFQAAFLLLVIVIGLNIVVRFVAARARRRLEGLFQ
jgi:phosphate transport system permease protein